MMRYAVYYLPDPASALWRFGSSAIGHDAYSGADVAFPSGAPYDRPDWAQLTSEPRRYGFHATLKAPFELAAGTCEDGLLAAARGFAEEHAPFDLPALEVRALSRFIALVPSERSSALQALAAAAVRHFEPFRGPLGEADMARRLRSPLSGRQKSYLETWGYPYVLDEFRFHMTLTGPLEGDAMAMISSALGEHYRRVDAPVRIDAITVCRQPSREERFQAIARLPLR